MLKKIHTLIILAVITANVFAQNGKLKGKVTDASTGEPIPFANVSLEENGSVITGGMTDFDGNYTISPIPAGKYTVKASYLGYQTFSYNGVVINAGKVLFLNFKLSSSVENIKTVEVVDYKVPLISKDQTTSGGTVTAEDIEKMPGRSASSVASTVGGVYSEDGAIGSIRGARSEGNVYYVDGVKVRGSSAIPKAAQAEVEVILGGHPAKYGDATGGIISVTSKGPSRKFFGGFEYMTSEGFHPYGYNLLGFSFTGPLIRIPDKKDTTGKKTNTLLGFFLAGELTSSRNGSSQAVDYWVAKDDIRQQIINNPMLRSNQGQGAVQAADFLREDSFEKTNIRENDNDYGANINMRFDLQPAKSVNFTLGGNFIYNNSTLYNRSSSLFNNDNYGNNEGFNARAFFRITQKFIPETPEQAEKALIKNAWYSLQFDVVKIYSKTQNTKHKDNLFAYGHIGTFESYKIPYYSYGTDTNLNLSGYRLVNFYDTAVHFTPSTYNPDAAQYTQNVYDIFPETYYHNNLTEIQGLQGFLNGEGIPSVYGLWSSPGTQYNSYAINNDFQFRVTASGKADIGDHEVSLGFEFEQRIDRYFGISPRSLWEEARQLMNSHISEIDFDSAIPVYVDGVFQDTIIYQREYSKDNQRQFDIRFREHLGKPLDGLEYIDIDAYDPSEFSIEYFSPEELLNDGNPYVTYYGYDYKGDRLSHTPSFKDFFTDTYEDEVGNIRKKREIAPFAPNYTAAYIQDKFSFDDLVFNVGVRVDRYDLNQKVLKDEYLLQKAYTAGEVPDGDLRETIPSSIEDDYVVYVDNYLNPGKIVGYRNERTWYDENGEEITDPTLLYQAGTINPYLENPSSNISEVMYEAFEDYEPQITVMPRISFSFPISDEALFFAHYDVLTQRPRNNTRLDPVNYLFLESSAGDFINNPNAKPEKTIDYELGFQQKLTNSSSIKLSAFYKEMRDMQQVVNNVGAHPSNYLTMGNIDFGTVKGFTVSYDLRRTGNVSMRASYTLQFADATGSDATSALSLVSSEQPNLRTIYPTNFDQRHAIVGNMDYRYSMGKAYTGPVLWGRDILQNTGVNVVLNAGSGKPYSKRSIVGNVLEGTINGSRMPWRLTVDLRIDRDIALRWGKGEDNNKRKARMNIYLDIFNVFNTKNILYVYGTTGNPDDDGYLLAPENQPSINSQNDPEAYRNYYTMLINNPGNYSLPRRVRAGVQVSF